MGTPRRSSDMWNDPEVSIDVGDTLSLSGNVTLDDGSKIATVAAVTDITNPVALKGNVTLDDGSVINTVNAVTSITNQEYSYKYTSGPTTDWVIKNSAGYLKSIIVGDAIANGGIEVSDHASDGDGAVKVHLLSNASIFIGPKTYDVNVAFSTGITADITTQTNVTMVYR